ncbi:hypothetical protein OIU84_007908 [Salix udensis]|uniref:6-phosphogluconate dehydrogenase NADP-binding domain-containing protein n=1 Tax=Salix udensis TaxID=889485 RepID=A0AAD6P055_9ROSI|nr:hypothetical protein OIU84_007908 [Salix udensis]
MHGWYRLRSSSRRINTNEIHTPRADIHRETILLSFTDRSTSVLCLERHDLRNCTRSINPDSYGDCVCEACVAVAAAMKKSPEIVLLMLFGLTILRLLKNISEVPALPPVWGPGANIQDAASAELYEPEQLARQIIAKSTVVKRIGFIGLGAMEFGMSTHLLKSNFCVVGYDVNLHFFLFLF